MILTLGMAQSQEVNVLTEAEKAQGWQLMFDGRNLTGWHSYKKTHITLNGWIIKDSSIYMRGPAAGAILAPEAFVLQNFEISIDWKTPDSGNSGIFLRYLEKEESENVRTGPESQVCGRLRNDYKTGTEVTSPGACYDMYAPVLPWIKSADQFNTFHVIMYENHVAHYGNGKRLLEYVIGSPDWLAKFKDSKYSAFTLYGDIHPGKLFLQDHASPVWYRNIKIRELKSDPWATPGFAWPDQNTGIGAGSTARRPVLSIASAGANGLSLRFSSATDWDLALSNAAGHRLQSLRGAGKAAWLGGPGLKAGTYLLSGTLGGRPYARPISVAGAR
jgi:hypothetical protein